MPSSENRDVVSLIQAADFCLKSTISLATSVRGVYRIVHKKASERMWAKSL